MHPVVAQNMQQLTVLGTQLQSARVSDFTGFQQLDLEFSPGLNVFIGPPGTA